MSWLAASLVVLGLALVAGFAWYERTHPTARVLALVATLAALAALGRIAFAPLPNVKPTTDIVLLTGYALGGAPGFAVGAVAALASNVFFGQGPWTPWQMCAWGGVGDRRRAAGPRGRARARARCAGGRLRARRGGLRRVMNLHLWVTYSGDHSLAKLGAFFATSFPFDLAHVVGNVLFCLLFGPALVRALTRYRQRFEVTWRPRARARGRRPRRARARQRRAAAGPGRRPAARAELARAAQNADGGFGGAPGQRSSGLYSSWAGLGLAAAGRNPRDVRPAAAPTSSTTCAPTRPAAAPTSATPRARSCSCGRPAWRRGSARATSCASCWPSGAPSGAFAGRVNSTAFAIFALRAAGRSRSDRAVRSGARWIAGQANPDGGFNFAGKGGSSGIDDTGAALQGLVAAGRRGTPTVRRAARFLARRQNPDGGYPLQPGGPSNAQSTAWAVQGLVAAGRNPDRQRRNGARSPTGYLRSLVTPGGAVRYSRTSAQTPVWVTAQALAALARKPFPLAPVPRAKRAAPAPAPTPAPTPAPGGPLPSLPPRSPPRRRCRRATPALRPRPTWRSPCSRAPASRATWSERSSPERSVARRLLGHALDPRQPIVPVRPDAREPARGRVERVGRTV